MKKLLIIAIMALSFCLPFVGNLQAMAEIYSSVRVVYPYAYVYEAANAGEESAILIKTCNYNEVLTTIGTEVVVGGVDNLEYYQVQITDVPGYESGYVLKSQVVGADVQSPKKELNINATINQECDIYILNGTDYEKTGEKLASGTKIRWLKNVDNYSQIQYTDAQQNIITAYVLINVVGFSGISRATIGAVIIIITTVSLVLIIFGISGKKKKKKNI